MGKGTQSERLLQRFPQLSSISSGDLLRNNRQTLEPKGMWCLHQWLRASFRENKPLD